MSMAGLAEQSTDALFRRWRHGDAESGQIMAQRFLDWYYAIASCRLGEAGGRPALERACQCFAQGILAVNEPEDLAPWAHGLLLDELNAHGGRSPGGDQPGRATGERSPTALLRSASSGLPRDTLSILALAYDQSFPMETLTQACEAHGGHPHAVPHARYQLKRWLSESEGVDFMELPDSPSNDRAPLPLYEAGRMLSKAEDDSFEHWMLSDLSLCRDVAEFAPFALALRGGALAAYGGAPVGRRASGHEHGFFHLPEDGDSRKRMWFAAGVGLVVVVAAAWSAL